MEIKQKDVQTPQVVVLSSWHAGAKGRVGISGTLTYRDKDGNIVGTTDISGSVPLQPKE